MLPFSVSITGNSVEKPIKKRKRKSPRSCNKSHNERTPEESKTPSARKQNKFTPIHTYAHYSVTLKPFQGYSKTQQVPQMDSLFLFFLAFCFCFTRVKPAGGILLCIQFHFTLHTRIHRTFASFHFATRFSVQPFVEAHCGPSINSEVNTHSDNKILKPTHTIQARRLVG